MSFRDHKGRRSEHADLAGIHQRQHTDRMLITSLVLVGFVTGVLVITGAVAAICRLVTKSRAVSLMIGTLAIPALILASFVYGMLTMGDDDAPPGMVIIGNLIAVAIIMPLALLASNLTNRCLDRRALRNVG